MRGCIEIECSIYVNAVRAFEYRRPLTVGRKNIKGLGDVSYNCSAIVSLTHTYIYTHVCVISKITRQLRVKIFENEKMARAGNEK